VVWDVSGEVVLRVTRTAGANAVISGLFLSQGSSAVVLYDTDGDGMPDYFEDRNGNGSVNTGETDWNSASDLGLKVRITKPKTGQVVP
jgi:hypothetical protein